MYDQMGAQKVETKREALYNLRTLGLRRVFFMRVQGACCRCCLVIEGISAIGTPVLVAAWNR